MPYNKKTHEKNERKFDRLFDLRGAHCLGRVIGEDEGWLFKKEGEIIFLKVSGYSMALEKKDCLVFRFKKEGKVFPAIFNSRYFEQKPNKTWVLHQGGK